jgi:hypothetical protein
MTTGKTIRRSVSVRRSPVPRVGKVASGYLGLLGKLSEASKKLERARAK